MLIQGQKALTENSTCTCAWTGTIEITDPGTAVEGESLHAAPRTAVGALTQRLPVCQRRKIAGATQAHRRNAVLS